MTTNEIKDRNYTALDNLRELADDFTEGSQQRWLVALRETSALRDELWRVQQLSQMDQE